MPWGRSARAASPRPPVDEHPRIDEPRRPAYGHGTLAEVTPSLAAALGVDGVRAANEPSEFALVGHHGSLTAAEQLVPLLLARG